VILLALCRGYQSLLCLALSNDMLATQYANEGSILFSQVMELQSNFLLPWQFKSIELCAKVHFKTKNRYMLALDISTIQRMDIQQMAESTKQLLYQLECQYETQKNLESTKI